MVIRPGGQRQYFVHCDTMGISFRKLFVSDIEAHRVYQESGKENLEHASWRSLKIEVVKIAFANSWSFGGEEPSIRFYGLASESELLYPGRSAVEPLRVLTERGIDHFSTKHSDGAGIYDAALCDLKRDRNVIAEDTDLSDLFGVELKLCIQCKQKLILHPHQ